MPNEQHDADFQGSFFELVMDQLSIGFFTGCSGLTVEFDVIPFKQGDGKRILEQKLPGKAKYEQIVLKRGFTESKVLYEWFDKVVQAKDMSTIYKTGAINIYNRHQQKVAGFSILGAWPSKLKVSDLSATSTEVMVEELTIEHEFLDWV